jgi:hypothetical protein
LHSKPKVQRSFFLIIASMLIARGFVFLVSISLKLILPIFAYSGLFSSAKLSHARISLLVNSFKVI